MAYYQEIENRRCADVFYGLLFNETVRKNIFQNTIDIVNNEFKNKEKSFRLNLAVNRISNTNIILLQHVFIFFAMIQEENVYHYIVNHYPIGSDRRKEVEAFIKGQMTQKTDDLLNGKYRSIVEFIDDLRATITFDIGFE